MAAIVSQNFHLIQQRVVDHLRPKVPDMLTHNPGVSLSLFFIGFGISVMCMEAHRLFSEFSPLDLPSKLVDRISKGDPNRFRKFAWLAPAIGITSLTLGCYVAYIATPYAFLKGVIAGVHCNAMLALIDIGRFTIRKRSDLEKNNGAIGTHEVIYKIITLDNVLGMYFCKGCHDQVVDTQTINSKSMDMSYSAEKRATFVAFACFALGWLVNPINPIITSTVLYLAQTVYMVVCKQLSKKTAAAI